MRHIHQAVAEDGSFEFLQTLNSFTRTSYSEEDLHSMMTSYGVLAPKVTLHDLIAANLLVQRGETFGLTTFGIRTCLLLEAVNGADGTCQQL